MYEGNVSYQFSTGGNGSRKHVRHSFFQRTTRSSLDLNRISGVTYWGKADQRHEQHQQEENDHEEDPDETGERTGGNPWVRLISRILTSTPACAATSTHPRAMK